MRKLYCHICDLCRIVLQTDWSSNYTDEKGMYLVSVKTGVLELCKQCYDKIDKEYHSKNEDNAVD